MGHDWLETTCPVDSMAHAGINLSLGALVMSSLHQVGASALPEGSVMPNVQLLLDAQRAAVEASLILHSHKHRAVSSQTFGAAAPGDSPGRPHADTQLPQVIKCFRQAQLAHHPTPHVARNGQQCSCHGHPAQRPHSTRCCSLQARTLPSAPSAPLWTGS